MSPFYTGIAHLWMGEVLVKKKDWEAAIAALREAIRLLPERRALMYVPTAYLALGKALAGAGRHAEAREELLTALLARTRPGPRTRGLIIATPRPASR